jgi:hypothetical protein
MSTLAIVPSPLIHMLGMDTDTLRQEWVVEGDDTPPWLLT